jgi:hypothetical protein
MSTKIYPSENKIAYDPTTNQVHIFRSGMDEAAITLNKITNASQRRIDSLTYRYQAHLCFGWIFIHHDRMVKV